MPKFRKLGQILAVLCAAQCLFGSQITAEIYKGIGPLDTLSEVKLKFPGADYKQLRPAWAQEWDVLYSVSGRGLSGTIIVKFFDSRPNFKKTLQNDPETKDKEMLQKLAMASDEEALSVEWVRWIPDGLIPLQRFVSKYGKPSKSGFDDDDLQPYREWPSGITAFLSDDEKSVARIDYTFTQEENRRAYQAKYGSRLWTWQTIIVTVNV